MKSAKTKRRRSKKSGFPIAPLTAAVLGLMVIGGVAYRVFTTSGRLEFAENPTGAMAQNREKVGKPGKGQEDKGHKKEDKKRDKEEADSRQSNKKPDWQITFDPEQCEGEILGIPVGDIHARLTLMGGKYLVTIPGNIQPAAFGNISITAESKDGSQRIVTLDKAIPLDKMRKLIKGDRTVGGISFDCKLIGDSAREPSPSPSPSSHPDRERKITFQLNEYPEGTLLKLNTLAKVERRTGKTWIVTVPGNVTTKQFEQYAVVISNEAQGINEERNIKDALKDTYGAVERGEIVGEVVVTKGYGVLATISIILCALILICLALVAVLGWEPLKRHLFTKTQEPQVFAIDKKDFGDALGILSGHDLTVHLTGRGMRSVTEVMIDRRPLKHSIFNDTEMDVEVDGYYSQDRNQVEVTFYLAGSNPKKDYWPVKSPPLASLQIQTKAGELKVGQLSEVYFGGTGFDRVTKVLVDKVPIPINNWQVSGTRLSVWIDGNLTRGKDQVCLAIVDNRGEQDNLFIDVEQAVAAQNEFHQGLTGIERDSLQPDADQRSFAHQFQNQTPVSVVAETALQQQQPPRDFDPQSLYRRLVAGERKIGEIYLESGPVDSSGVAVSVRLKAVSSQGVPFILFENGGSGFVYPNPILGYNQGSLIALFPDLSREEYERHRANIQPVTARKEGDFWIAAR